MLTEDDVVAAVAGHLRTEGWTITIQATTSQHGPDLVAEREGRRLMVEAKGATSSKEWTARFSRPFAGKQVRTHVAVALYTCLQWRDGPEHAYDAVAIALPDTPIHRKTAGRIAPSLDALGIPVFWVEEDGTVHGTQPPPSSVSPCLDGSEAHPAHSTEEPPPCPWR